MVSLGRQRPALPLAANVIAPINVDLYAVSGFDFRIDSRCTILPHTAINQQLTRKVGGLSHRYCEISYSPVILDPHVRRPSVSFPSGTGKA